MIAMVLGALSIRWSAGQSRTKSAVATVVNEEPTLDGVLDDSVWSAGQPLTGFLQRDPHEGELSTEPTEVRILYTKEALYIGIRCYDARPEAIIATERRRDQDLTKDDSVAILLDTFRDRRNAYLFRTNALGTQYDALVTDEGRDINVFWDETWESMSVVDEEGWSAEVRIPFKSLRMRKQETMVWGLEVERLIRRKNEAVYWNTSSRNFTFEDVSQAGILSGLEEAGIGLRLRVKPFILGGFGQSPGSNGQLRTENLSEVGLEVLKYRPTRALTLELTLNTDFAETEVDDLVTNVTRFPLFFPERREFFLENAGVFEFGTGVGLGGSRDFKLFHSRRIGLSPQREPIPILGGVKLTGRLGAYTLGFINTQTDSSRGLPSNNSTVFRIKRDLFERSSVGAMLTNRQSSEDGDYNRAFGADANFVFARNLNIYTFLAKADSSGFHEDEGSAFFRILWDSDYLLMGLEHLRVEKNFNPELGFVPRRDQKKTTLQFGVRPRPKSDLIRQLVFRTRLDYTETQDGIQESINYHFLTFESRFQSGDRILVDSHRTFERLLEPFQIRPDIRIPVGGYRGWNILTSWDGAPHRRISGRNLLRFRYEWGFFGGNRIELRVQPQIKLSDSLSIDTAYALDDIRLPQGDFTSHVINTRVNYAFSNRWLTSTTVQYSNLDRLVNFRFRLNYIYRPGDDLFLIYNEGRNIGLDQPGSGLLGRALLIKFTHSFDF